MAYRFRAAMTTHTIAPKMATAAMAARAGDTSPYKRLQPELRTCVSGPGNTGCRIEPSRRRVKPKSSRPPMTTMIRLPALLLMAGWSLRPEDELHDGGQSEHEQE